MASFLQVENISKSYGDKVLFRNISFNINEGPQRYRQEFAIEDFGWARLFG